MRYFTNWFGRLPLILNSKVTHHVDGMPDRLRRLRPLPRNFTCPEWCFLDVTYDLQARDSPPAFAGDIVTLRFQLIIASKAAPLLWRERGLGDSMVILATGRGTIKGNSS